MDNRRVSQIRAREKGPDGEDLGWDTLGFRLERNRFIELFGKPFTDAYFKARKEAPDPRVTPTDDWPVDHSQVAGSTVRRIPLASKKRKKP